MRDLVGTFCDPPESSKGTGKRYHAEREAMRANPGRWMLIRTAATHRLLSSGHMNFKAHGFEARINRIDAETVGLWARWPA